MIKQVNTSTSKKPSTMKHILLTSALLFLLGSTYAQNVGIGTTTPDSSAKIDITSDSSGMLIPRMTDIQRNAINSPATGLLVFVTTDSTFYFFDGAAWTTFYSRTRMLVDADADTKIQVEESGDEDHIRFDVDGVEAMVIDSNANVGIGTSLSDPSAKLELASTTEGFLPPRMTNDELAAIVAPAEGLIVYSTDERKPLFYDGADWRFYDGTVLLYVGKLYEGGVIFHLDGNGGGLVCAVSDQDGGSGINWWNGTNIATGADSTAIGTGQFNTTQIVNTQGAGSYAAYICDTLTLNDFTNWFLPSKDELNEMYNNKSSIDATATTSGGSPFVNDFYWSSSEVTPFSATFQYFSDGGQGPGAKAAMFRVRAIRAF